MSPKYTVLTCLLLVAFLQNSLAASNFSTSCGDILTSTEGLIEYKVNENWGEHERCIWVVRVEHAVEYEFNVNWPDASFVQIPLEGIHINSFNGTGRSTVRPLNSSVSYVVHGNLAVVTFYTHRYTDGQGFQLFYKASRFDDNSTSDQSVQRIFSQAELGSSIQVSHPAAGGDYSNNEVSAFIFAPNFAKTEDRKVSVRFDKIDIGEYCNDYLEVYRFGSSLLGLYSWTPSEPFKLCYEDPGWEPVLAGSDAIMVIFRSDSAQVSSGFNVTFSLGEW